METKQIKVKEIVFREDLYPRIEEHDPEKVKLYAEDMEVELKFSIAHLHSHGRSIAWIDKGIIRFPRNDRDFCESVWNLWKSSDDEIGIICHESEEQFRVRVITQLESEGYSCRKEVKVTHGRVDIIAIRNDITSLIEVKTSTQINSISSALGQLIFYTADYPEAILVLALPNPPDEKIVDILKSYGISVLVIKE